MIQIQIHSRETGSRSQTREPLTPALHTLNKRKEFTQIRQIGEQLIVLDRYRFEIINIATSLSLTRSKSTGASKTHQQLSKLRKSGDVSHCTFSESQETFVLIANDTLHTYSFAEQQITS
jgi:hypothetical protein